MKLSDLEEGKTAIIVKLNGRGAFRKRLMEMGFVKGKEIKAIRNAPLNDPVEYSIMGYEVSLRREEAFLIDIIPFEESHQKILQTSDKLIIESEIEYANASPSKKIKIALIGNPNSGKTTIFNNASGLREKVGNYAGVTVDAKYSEFIYDDYTIQLTDLPGTYSVSSYSPEEIYVRQHIMENSPDVIINVVDGSNLGRNLYLTTELLDMDIKMMIALNMYDELYASGARFNYPELSKMIGVPIVPTVGKRNKGIQLLLDKAIELYEGKEPVYRRGRINYGLEIEKAIMNIQTLLPDGLRLTQMLSPRFVAVKILEGDRYFNSEIKWYPNYNEINNKAKYEIARLAQFFNNDTETILTDARYGFIAGALKETLKESTIKSRNSTEKIDNILTNRLIGFPFFILFMWVTFQTTFALGKFPMAWLQLAVEFISNGVSQILTEGPFKALLINGIIGGVGGVIVFLPNILILFFFIALMEDTGYMARAAFIMDKLMHKMGLHGKSFIPLLMGFGCNVPAVMATRTIENRSDRILTMIIIPFMSCSARFPVFILLTSAFFPDNAGTVIFILYLLGIILAVLMSLLMRKTIFKDIEAPFVMELPPYRIPTVKNLTLHIWDKGEQYLKKMGGIILIASVFIWALSYYPRNKQIWDNYAKAAAQITSEYNKLYAVHSNMTDSLQNEFQLKMANLKIEYENKNLEYSYIGYAGKFLCPIIAPLGFDWKMGVSLLAGLPAKEIIVSSMGVLYHNNNDNSLKSQPLPELLKNHTYNDGLQKGQKVFSPLIAFAFMAFILLYFPCIAVFSAIGKESGSWKWPLFTSLYSTLLAWIISFVIYQIGSLIQ